MGSTDGDYEVFLSFRGADTRQGFTDVLYEHMSHANIRVFRDDDALRIGDKIDSILGFIVNSKICIPIFSPKFVQSRYCLLEVTKMVELNKTIVPIFYHVTSDDVKLKTSLYVNDFQKLEEIYGNHQVDKWKEALKEVVSYKGRKVGVKGYSQFCKEFVVEVLSKLRHREQEAAVSDEIYGMGGISAVPIPTHNIATFEAPVTVLGQEFVSPHPTDLVFREIRTMRKYDITDSKGNIIFKIKSHLLKFSEQLLDASGKTLVTMQQKIYRWSFDVHAYRGKSTDKKDLLFMVKYPKGLDQMSTNYKFKHCVYLAQNTNEDVWDYRVECCWSEKTCVIYVGNTNNIVAQILSNEGTVKKSHFGITVYPNIDYAFVVALLVSSECVQMFS